MRESIESWKAILLAVEMFCLGGSIFCRSNTKTILELIVVLIGVVLIAAM